MTLLSERPDVSASVERRLLAFVGNTKVDRKPVRRDGARDAGEVPVPIIARVIEDVLGQDRADVTSDLRCDQAFVRAASERDHEFAPAIRKPVQRRWWREEVGDDHGLPSLHPVTAVPPVEEEGGNATYTADAPHDVCVGEPPKSLSAHRDSSMSALLKLVCAKAGGLMPEAARRPSLWMERARVSYAAPASTAGGSA